ncbi:MAG: FKBP12-associated protein [Trizodia sp. TS-e1964]|nr:MAG: FKBP12-associated protein [Trizodia sp. TS-e1964]
MSLGDQSHFVLPIVGTSSLSSSTLIKDSPEIQFTARILAATMVDSTAPQKAPKRPHRKRPPRAPKPSPAVEPPASDSPMPQVQVQGHRQDQQRRTTHPESSLASNRMVGGRHFGGLLSSSLAEPQPRNIDRALDAAAPEFLPSRPMPTNRGRGKSHRYGNPRSPIQPFQKSIHKRRTTKSPALDLATRIHEDIVNGLYECPICTNELERSSKIWSCGTCWTVFHLSCIKKWSQNDASVQAEQLLQEELPLIKAWRCPGCNLPQDVRPNYYTCWYSPNNARIRVSFSAMPGHALPVPEADLGKHASVGLSNVTANVEKHLIVASTPAKRNAIHKKLAQSIALFPRMSLLGVPVAKHPSLSCSINRALPAKTQYPIAINSAVVSFPVVTTALRPAIQETASLALRSSRSPVDVDESPHLNPA